MVVLKAASDLSAEAENKILLLVVFWSRRGDVRVMDRTAAL